MAFVAELDGGELSRCLIFLLLSIYGLTVPTGICSLLLGFSLSKELENKKQKLLRLMNNDIDTGTAALV